MADIMDQELDFASAFAACKSLVCLSGFREIWPDYLPAIYPACANLISLNFSYADISADQLISVIRHCHKLQTFWVSFVLFGLLYGLNWELEIRN